MAPPANSVMPPDAQQVNSPAAQLVVQALLTDDASRRRKLLAAAAASDPNLLSTLSGLMRDSGWDGWSVKEDLQLVPNATVTIAEGAYWPEVLSVLLKRLARLDQLENQFAATVELEKLAAMYSLAYGASHEINNPLANISSRAQTLLRDETDPEKRRKLETINSQAFRAHEMIADLMLFAKPPNLQLQVLDVAEVLQLAEREWQPLAAAQQTELLIKAEAGQFPIRADRQHLFVALQSLFRNSLEALGTGGRIILRLNGLTAGTEEFAVLSVEDDGPGIPAEVLPRIFDPFFSGREAGRGLGLGLSKCWRIVTLHSGTISVHSQAGRGALFTIQLPLAGTGE